MIFEHIILRLLLCNGIFYYLRISIISSSFGGWMCSGGGVCSVDLGSGISSWTTRKYVGTWYNRRSNIGAFASTLSSIYEGRCVLQGGDYIMGKLFHSMSAHGILLLMDIFT